MTKLPPLFCLMEERVYKEALTLLQAAQSYIRTAGREEILEGPTDFSLLIINEITRANARLAQVIAWYLAQDSFRKGKLTLRDMLSTEHALEPTDALLEDLNENNDALAEEVKHLLKRTRELYCRVLLLDETFREKQLQKQAVPW